MANWLVTVNYAEFDLEAAYDALPQIYWKNSATSEGKGLQINDIVHVYVTQPISKVMYQFKVLGHAENSEYPVAQKVFWSDKKKIESYLGGYSIFEKLNKVDKSTLSFEYFRQENLIPDAPIQGRRTDRDKASNDPIRIFLTHIFNEFKTDKTPTVNNTLDYKIVMPTPRLDVDPKLLYTKADSTGAGLALGNGGQYTSAITGNKIDIPSFGSMNLKEAKEWLNQQSLELEARIKNIEKNSSLDSEQLAFIAINMRNSFINSARNAVYDKRVFASLELDQPLWDYKYLESKYAKEGYSGEALNRKIIADSSDKKMLDDAMTLRHFDGIEDDLLYQLAQDMETNGAREMRSTVEQGGCFPAGTRVMTDKGLVSIQDIKTGDMVLSKPENGEGEICYKPVVRTVSYDNKEIWELSYFEISADTDISKLTRIKLLQISRKGKMFSTMATPNHPFWVKGVGWTRLDELKNGQIIETNDPKILALVFMVNPLRKTSKPNVAGSYHPRNLFDADKKGFEIEDVEYFDLFEYSDLGLCGVLGENSSSPFMVDNHEIHVLKENFTLKVYNFEVADHHTYFITKRGLWVHNTNCAEATPDAAPKDLVTRSGNEISKKDTLGHDINV
ncbi:polymorphic toxin-type HINT domain-containing protein [Acinetobacter sp. Lyrl_1]|uniref:polymorphic toxin-type HINT domain-containing protein n=1 Tax=Acinetobacter sp. Lyrl_1 TaxID=3110920 RepID=UPI003F7BFDC1